MNENTLKVTTSSGNKLQVNISDKACQPSGFKHEDRVKHFIAGFGTVMGTALHPDIKINGLWVAFDDDSEKVSWIAINNAKKDLELVPPPEANKK